MNYFASVCMVFYLAPCCLVRAAPMKVIAPRADARASGIYRFSVDISNAPTVDRVEYRLGSWRLGNRDCPTVRHNLEHRICHRWQLFFGGRRLRCHWRRDRHSAPDLDIQNQGCTLTVNSDLSSPLHGKVNLSLTGVDPLYFPARWSVFLDGILQNIEWSDNTGQNKSIKNLTIDTTRMLNGKHELHVEVASDFWSDNRNNKSWHDSRLALHRVISIDNGRHHIAITANLLHVYLKPGQTSSLSCRVLNADASSEPCAAPSYESSNPKVAAVDRLGVLHAQNNEGFANISITNGNQKTEVYVWVRRISGLPLGWQWGPPREI